MQESLYWRKAHSNQLREKKVAGGVPLAYLDERGRMWFPMPNGSYAPVSVLDEDDFDVPGATMRASMVVSNQQQYIAAHDAMELLTYGGHIQAKRGCQIVCDPEVGGLYANVAKVGFTGMRNRIDHSQIVRGTAVGATTDGTAHDIGTKQIRLAQLGNGSILPGNVVMVIGSNDVTTYWVKNKVLDVAGGGVLELKQPLQKPIPASGCQVVIMAAPGLMIDYINDVASGADARDSKASSFGGFKLHGPGRRSWGSRSVYVSGTQAGKAPRPTFYDLITENSEVGFGGRNLFFLSNIFGVEMYQHRYGIYQEAGSDSGENISIYAGPIHFCDCIIRNDEPDAGIYLYSNSLNHSYQWFLLRANTNLSMISPHVENRAKGASTDPTNYILDGSARNAQFTGSVSGNVLTVTAMASGSGAIYDRMILGGPVYLKPGVKISFAGGGTGTGGVGTYILDEPVETIPSQFLTLGDDDGRAPLAGFNSFGDADGDSNIVIGGGGTMDFNTDGGATGPYPFWHLFNVRAMGTRIHLDRIKAVNFANFANQVWVGPGQVTCDFIVKSSTDPLMPSRMTSDQRKNLFGDWTMNTLAVKSSGQKATALNLQQPWWISLDADGATPTSRVSGTNADIALVIPPGGATASFTGSVAGNILTASGITGTIAQGSEITTTVGGVTVSAHVMYPHATTPNTWYLSNTTLNGLANAALTSTQPGGTALFTAGTMSAGSRVLNVTAVSQGKIRRGATVMGSGGVANATIEGPLDAGAAAGGVGKYLLSTGMTVAAGTAMAACVFRAIEITRKGNLAGGDAALSRISTAVRALAGKRVVMNFLTYVPTGTTLNATGNFRFELAAIRLAKENDANGVPQVIERFNPTDAVQFAPNSSVGSWEERAIRAYNALALPPDRATEWELMLRMETLTAGGKLYIALPSANVAGC